MRILLIAILTLSIVQAFAQKTFTGTYFTTKKDIGFESDLFQFKDDGTFNYVFFTCTGIGLGKGNYKVIDGDSLQLQFTDCEKCEDVKQIEVVTQPSDSLEVDLRIKAWEDGSEIVGANVYFPLKRIGTVSNESGQAKLKTSKFDESQTLRIQFIGYDPVDMEIPVGYSVLKGTIYLTWHWVYDSSETKTFRIVKWTKSKLKLIRYPDLIITYDRVNPSKTDKLIEERMGKSGFELYKEKIKTPANIEQAPRLENE